MHRRLHPPGCSRSRSLGSGGIKQATRARFCPLLYPRDTLLTLIPFTYRCISRVVLFIPSSLQHTMQKEPSTVWANDPSVVSDEGHDDQLMVTLVYGMLHQPDLNPQRGVPWFPFNPIPFPCHDREHRNRAHCQPSGRSVRCPVPAFHGGFRKEAPAVDSKSFGCIWDPQLRGFCSDL